LKSKGLVSPPGVIPNMAPANLSKAKPSKLCFALGSLAILLTLPGGKPAFSTCLLTSSLILGATFLINVGPAKALSSVNVSTFVGPTSIVSLSATLASCLFKVGFLDFNSPALRVLLLLFWTAGLALLSATI